MENTKPEYIISTLEKQKKFFATQTTKNLSYRKEALKKLLHSVEEHEQLLAQALWEDLHKSYEEAYLTEISLVKAEIKNHLRHLRKWTKSQCKLSPLALFPSSSKIVTEPLGNALIMAPWNYPFLLLFGRSLEQFRQDVVPC